MVVHRDLVDRDRDRRSVGNSREFLVAEHHWQVISCPGSLTVVEPVESERPSPDWRRRVIVAAVALGVVAVIVVVVVRWWRSGAVRRAVKDLAEEGAVALADVIVDELLPAA
jgi:hypothetical protein